MVRFFQSVPEKWATFLHYLFGFFFSFFAVFEVFRGWSLLQFFWAKKILRSKPRISIRDAFVPTAPTLKIAEGEKGKTK